MTERSQQPEATMTEREQFESWWLKDVPENHRDFAKKLLAGYGQDYAAAPGVADAWTTWRASRRTALEEAAKACMRATPNAQTRKAIGDAAHYLACAVAIRALANGETYD